MMVVEAVVFLLLLAMFLTLIICNRVLLIMKGLISSLVHSVFFVVLYTVNNVIHNSFMLYFTINLKISRKYIFFWLCWVFIAVHGLPLVVSSRGYSLLRCVGFSLRWLLFVAEHRL